MGNIQFQMQFLFVMIFILCINNMSLYTEMISSYMVIPKIVDGMQNIIMQMTNIHIIHRGGGSPSIPANCCPLHGPSTL